MDRNEIVICFDCMQSFELVPNELILSEYEIKFSSEGIISGFLPQYLFRKGFGFQKLIHALKYEKNYRIGIYLGNLIAEKSMRKLSGWDLDLIIPIPLFHLRKAERGYNQSFYIAKGLGEKLKIPVKQNIVIRKKSTSTQTKLNLVERKQNMAGAFSLKNQKNIKQKNILLVDDIITTGSTITEVAKILKKKKAKKIYALSAGLAYLDSTSSQEPISQE